MKILLVKMTSMGDIIHTLPALTEAAKNIPNIHFDWVAEQSFAEIPSLHPAVKRVIPIALRRWRKNIFSLGTFKECKNFFRQLRLEKYDKIIDAQGLLKSAIVTSLSRGYRCGLDYASAREAIASWFYQSKYSIDSKQHAIIRMRQIFANALGYQLVETKKIDYGIATTQIESPIAVEDYLVFVHAASIEKKLWPVENWTELAVLASQYYKIYLPWGTAAEKIRAEYIAKQIPNVRVLPQLNLIQLTAVLHGAKAVVAVDTGLGHLAAALSVPTISLYAVTDPALIGTVGQAQTHLSIASPDGATAQQVWQSLISLMEYNDGKQRKNCTSAAE